MANRVEVFAFGKGEAREQLKAWAKENLLAGFYSISDVSEDVVRVIVDDFNFGALQREKMLNVVNDAKDEVSFHVNGQRMCNTSLWFAKDCNKWIF